MIGLGVFGFFFFISEGVPKSPRKLMTSQHNIGKAEAPRGKASFGLPTNLIDKAVFSFIM